jgi:hypothetical protein
MSLKTSDPQRRGGFDRRFVKGIDGRFVTTDLDTLLTALYVLVDDHIIPTHQRARYSACCTARTGSRNDPETAGLAETALTRPLLHTTPVNEVAALPITGGHVVRSAQPVPRPPPTPSRPAIHFPRSPVIGHHAPATPSAGHRAGEGLPSSRRHYLNVPRPIRRRVPRGCNPGATPLPWPSPRFRRALGTPPSHPHGRLSNDAAGFASRYGPLQSLPLKGPSTLGFDAGRSPRRRQSATGPPGSYPDRTHTGKRRRAYERRSTSYTVNLHSPGRTENAH